MCIVNEITENYDLNYVVSLGIWVERTKNSAENMDG